MAFSRDWNETTPTDDTIGYDLDDHIRNLREDVRERAGEQHLTYDDDDGETDVWEHKPGECNVLHVGTKASFPTPESSNAGAIAIATDEANKPYYWSGSAWTTCALALLGASNTFAEVQTWTKGVVANNTYIKARNAGDDGGVDLIKATTGDVAQIPNASVLASSAAPTADAQIANKKYVDDQCAAIDSADDMSPSTYAGEESVTFANGLIFKGGYVGRTGTPQTITFAAAFPTGVKTCQVTVKDLTTADDLVVVNAFTTTHIQIYSAAGAIGFYWNAWGY